MQHLILTVDRLEAQVSETFPVSELRACLRLLLPQQSVGAIPWSVVESIVL